MKVYIPIHRSSDVDYEDFIIGAFSTLEQAQAASEIEVKEMHYDNPKDPNWIDSPNYWIYCDDYPFSCIDIEEHELKEP